MRNETSDLRPQVPSPKSQVPSPKSQVPSPESQVPSPASQAPSLWQAVFVVFVIFRAVTRSHTASRGEFLPAVFAEEIPFRGTGQGVLVVFGTSAITRSHTARRGEFLPAELTVAWLLFSCLPSQLMLVVGGIGTVSCSYATGTAELLSAVTADKFALAGTACQNMLVVFGISAITRSHTARRREFFSAELTDVLPVYGNGGVLMAGGIGTVSTPCPACTAERFTTVFADKHRCSLHD